MKNSKIEFNTKKTSVVCFVFLCFMFPACSEKTTTQDSAGIDQVVVIEKEKEIEDTNVPESDTRVTYVQPKNNQTSNDKVVIDASSMSFKDLDTDNNEIVNAEEFYNGIYKLMDADANNTIDEAEFNKEENFLLLNKNSKLYSFTEWDLDANRQLSKEEIRNKLSALIDIPDGEKLAENLYIVWDTDNDDKVEKLELENVVIRFDPDSN